MMPQLARMVNGPPQAVAVKQSSIIRASQPTPNARRNLENGFIVPGFQGYGERKVSMTRQMLSEPVPVSALFALVLAAGSVVMTFL